jgi:predicted RNA binding protein YcfA (HicA-like mRNA interferase family)
MRALPALSGRAVIAALERAGVEVIRTKGSHHFLRHSDDHSWQTVVPVHRNDLTTRHTSRDIAAGAP